MAKTTNSVRVSGAFAGIILVLVAGVYLYLKFGPVPVAVADSPFPFEKKIVKLSLRACIDRQMKTAPFGTSEKVFESGAHIYHDRCSTCHGSPGHDAGYAQHMYPAPPQLWKKHGTREQWESAILSQV